MAHKCKSPKLYLLHGHDLLPEELGDDPVVEILGTIEPVDEPIIQEFVEPEISLLAIFGSIAPKSMRLIAWIRNHWVVILIDSGSTHNFIDLQSLPKPCLGELITLQLKVWVANGDIVLSSGKCPPINYSNAGGCHHF